MDIVARKLAKDEQLAQQVQNALSGGPLSPNAPENVAAAQAESKAAIDSIQAERRALEDAVRSGNGPE